MKRMVVIIFILTYQVLGFAKECKNLWFSQKQQDRQFVTNDGMLDATKIRVNYAKLDNGLIVKYTEMSSSNSYISNFDDMKFVGCGFFEKSEISNQEVYHSAKTNNLTVYKDRLIKNYKLLNQGAYNE